MLIDNSISEVFHRDKKVFIPDFGAIIHSDFNDEIDFNASLNFDDGKIIADIQRQQEISEDAAKSALSDYVLNIKNALEREGEHLLGGIGYINMDENGSITISKAKFSMNLEDGEEFEESNSGIDYIDDVLELNEKAENIEDCERHEEIVLNKADEAEDPNKTPSSRNDVNAIGDSNENLMSKDGENPDKDVDENPISEDEVIEDVDESADPIEDDENYEQHFNEEDPESEKNKRNSKLLYVGIIALFIIAIIPVYYFFIMNNSGEIHNEQSQVVEMLEDLPEKENTEVKKQEIISNDDISTAVTSESNKQELLADDNQQKYVDSINESDKEYSLILGSFKVENNALNFRDRLDEKGIDVSIFRRTNSFHFVGIESIHGKSNTLELLDIMRTEEEPTAWIIKKL